MPLDFNNKHLLPLTNIVVIGILLAARRYTDWVGTLFLDVCIFAQCVCLYGIYSNNNSLIGATHAMVAPTIFVGTFLGRKIINYILAVLLFFVIGTRAVTGGCMYHNYTKIYSDIVPMTSSGVDRLYGILLCINIYYCM